MKFTLQRSIHTATLLAALALVGCGAGSVKDPYNAPGYTGSAAATPTTASVILFGDGISDLTAGSQYTVNDDTGIKNWAVQVASSYGVPANGIMSYAAGNALVAGIANQVTSAGAIYGRDPLVLMTGGYRDIINAAEAGTSQAVAVAAAKAAGTAYAEVARSAVALGAKHVLIVNMYNLASTPYQTQGGRTTTTHPLSDMVRAFNDAMKSNLGAADKPYIGDKIRLANAEQYMGTLFGSPTGNGFTDATIMVCSTTAGDLGITGIALSSKGCTSATMTAPATATTYNNYIFADPINLTPAAHRSMGTGMRAFASW